MNMNIYYSFFWFFSFLVLRVKFIYMKIITSIFRWIGFSISLLLVIYAISMGFDWLASQVVKLSTFWFIVMTILFSTAAVGLFSMFCSILLVWMMNIPNNKTLAGQVFGVASILIGIATIVGYFMDDRFSILQMILININVITLWGVLARFGFNYEEILSND